MVSANFAYLTPGQKLEQAARLYLSFPYEPLENVGDLRLLDMRNGYYVRAQLLASGELAFKIVPAQEGVHFATL